ncbi:hypothetical protein MAPG_04449 [Magnaporthiopsis poae ATCC 64411]|uniref:ABM domain-containing protein n=1 Tax=Magnaporthiopsis poae (strain ATCC 64411 / 73-15) TaxID=644358 RepID=A0A0C4DWR9_MAGP6|nr:hypothetical protein MAPG_04449 [Magnaporthiopsis poae ATCC 64411]
MPVLEITYFGVKAGLDATDPGTAEGKIAHAVLTKAVRQPGAHAAYLAHSIENPTQVWHLMGWDSVEAHRAWRSHPDNPEIKQEMEASFIDPSAGPSFVKHVAVEPFPVEVLDTANAGVVEVWAAYFTAAMTTEEKARISAVFADFATKALPASPDFKGISMGWGVENDFPLPGGDGGDAGYAAHFALIGWTSVEGHQRFRETDAFKGSIGPLRTLPGLVKMSVCHIRCKSVKA